MEQTMDERISLDVHGQIRPTRASEELIGAGAVLAMTLSLDEAAQGRARHEPLVAWGVGCHPRQMGAQSDFDPKRFEHLVERAPFIGEVGLDVRTSRVPFELQLQTFRAALHTAAEKVRPVNIHSYTATEEVLEELRRQPVPVPILHGWTGTASQTREAAALGCYFSVHSAVARRSVFRTCAPPERILVETDHGWGDPPAAIPCRIEWVEHLLAESLKMLRETVRALAWRNFAAIVRETGIARLLPDPLVARLPSVVTGSKEATLF
jgi:TatD DNase family protein